METLTISATEVLDHHLQAFINNDLTEIMKDYTEASEVWTPDGFLVGLEAIAGFYTKAFALLPKGESKLEVKQRLHKENKAYLVWTADSPVVQIPLGTDSFEFRNNKIAWQSLAAQIIPK
ncbi:MAG: nuclear transport factor 2 family protein [Adhaeribacter sp.]